MDFSSHEIPITSETTIERYNEWTKFTKDGNPIDGIDRTSFTKAVEVSWKHFDPGAGVKIQILYIGQGEFDKEFRLNFDEYILGMGGLSNGREFSQFFNIPKTSLWYILLSFSPLLLFMLPANILIFKVAGRYTKASIWKYLAIVVVIVIIQMALTISFGQFLATPTIPPPIN